MSGFFSLSDRAKIKNELTRRYEEVLRKAEKGIHDDEEAQQFISLLAHYVYYVKKAQITQSAIKDLLVQHELVAGDQILIDEADKIIAQMKIDRGKLVGYAKKKNLKTDAYQFREGTQQITGDVELSFYLYYLDQFLNRSGDQQYVSEVPKEIGHLLSVNFVAQNLGGETSALKKMRADYRKVQNEFAKKLKMQGVYLDYMRVEDYKALEVIWRDVYQESNQDELLMFHLEYGHLFEKNHNYGARQQTEADGFVSKHITHLQRVHNYLIDILEDVPLKEKFLHWTIEHFGPTLASLILIILLWLGLHWIGIDINLDDLKSKTGL